MTRDEIIRMAVECQLVTTGNRDGAYMDAIAEFAALVAAAERESCANDRRDAERYRELRTWDFSGYDYGIYSPEAVDGAVDEVIRAR